MERIRVGLIGTGFGGNVVLPALRAVPGIEVSSVCAAHLEGAKAFAAAQGIPSATDNVRELVSGDVDLVVSCTPPRSHTDLVQAAMDAGRHVFSTKPLAPTVAAARRLRDGARERGLVTAMDLDNRYVPVRRYLRHLVRSGYLGDLRCVLATVFTNHSEDPAKRIHYWNWVSLRDECGGMLGASLLLHHVDLLRYTFGEVTGVGGLATTLVTEKPVLAPGHGEWTGLGPGTPTVGMRPVDAEDMVVLHGQLAAGGVFSLTGTWSVHHPSGVRVEAYGSEGTLVLNPDGRLLGARAEDPGLAELAVPARFGSAGSDTHVERFRLLFSDVAAAIRGEADDPLFARFDDGLRVREIAAAVVPET
ncbi:MAG TPA: Gfo/Idh/MocA family oxidoreductase [Amycolatopsis sp.]|nr:Gfo/Idh/MocA family oxidoreductase [Amycolatopsis sp.]